MPYLRNSPSINRATKNKLTNQRRIPKQRKKEKTVENRYFNGFKPVNMTIRKYQRRIRLFFCYRGATNIKESYMKKVKYFLHPLTFFLMVSAGNANQPPYSRVSPFLFHKKRNLNPDSFVLLDLPYFFAFFFSTAFSWKTSA